MPGSARGAYASEMGDGGSQHHRGTQSRDPVVGQRLGSPSGRPGLAGMGLPAEPGACRSYLGVASSTGHLIRWGEPTAGGPPHFPATLLCLQCSFLPPTQVVLTVALE